MKGWKKSLLIGFVIALTSEFYLSFFVSNFRVSPSVIIFPILLMTVGIEVPVIPNAVVTSALIFISRAGLQLFFGRALCPGGAGGFSRHILLYNLRHSVPFSGAGPLRGLHHEGDGGGILLRPSVQYH